jgi:hypothetical protein
MSQEMIEIVNPVGVAASKKTGLAPRLHYALDGLRIGLLDNNKPNADQFLEFIGELLKSRHGEIELIFKRKMSRTEAEFLRELIARCDVVHRVRRLRSCTSWSIHDSVKLESAGIPHGGLGGVSQLAETKPRGMADLP